MSTTQPSSNLAQSPYAAVMDLTNPGPGSGGREPRALFNDGLRSMSLNGPWRFHLSESLATAPVGVEEETFDDGAWETLAVPSSWNFHGHGRPAYTNVQFPFPLDPPHPPDANPIGDHRVTFDASDDYIDGAILRFDGIENAGTIWLNGTLLGTTRGSRLAQEFDVTGVLRSTANVLVARVAQFSAASYLEDQDAWWLPGIFRDVTLKSNPPSISVRDIFVRAGYTAEGKGSLHVELDPPFPGTVAWIRELGFSMALNSRSAVAEVGPVEPWSAEAPRLYALTVETPYQTLSFTVGFRSITVPSARPIMRRIRSC